MLYVRRLMALFIVQVQAFLVVNAQTDSAYNQLDSIVVTGQYQAQSLKQSVYQVRVINRKRIESMGATKLQDVLSNELNMRFSQDLALGGSDITMLGLQGQNVKILIDGVPMIGRQGTSNEININQIDVNSIQRVEIVEGPMSVVYGADALAGVINIITVKPGATQLTVNAGLHEETVNNEYGIKYGIHNPHANIGYRHNKWNISGGISNNYFGGWQGDAEPHDKQWNPKNQWFINGGVGYKTSKTNTRYRLDVLDETIKNPGAFVNDIAFNQQYITKRFMHQLQHETNFTNKLGLQVTASYTNYSRRTMSTNENKVTGEETLSLGAGQQDEIKFNGGMLRSYLVYRLAHYLTIQPGIDLNMESGSGERIDSGTHTINDYAFFLTAEVKPWQALSIKPGLRVEHNSVYQAPPVIPSINTKFIINKNTDVRLAYATGFRAPSLRELYFNFFDASHAIEGNPDLEAELSNSFTGSFNIHLLAKQNTQLTTGITAFYNDIHNMIGFAQKADDPAITTYINIDRYKTTGFTLTNRFSYKNFTLNAGLGYTGRYNQYNETDKTLPEFKWSPEVNATATYMFSKIGLDVNLYYKFTGKLPYYEQAVIDGREVIHLVSTDSYNWADVTINKSIGKLFKLNAGIRNLFNVTTVNNTAQGGAAHSETGARPIGYGRSFFAGLIFSFNKNYNQ